VRRGDEHRAGDDLVTWIDETSAVRADLAELRRNTRADIAELRHEMQVGFARMEANLTAAVANSRSDLMKWSFVFWVGAVAAIAVHWPASCGDSGDSGPERLPN
jgi:hypothetical protein